jgi:hypothetical protein
MPIARRSLQFGSGARLCSFCRPFGQIHFVNLPVERAAADAELFGSGGYVSV